MYTKNKTRFLPSQCIYSSGGNLWANTASLKGLLVGAVIMIPTRGSWKHLCTGGLGAVFEEVLSVSRLEEWYEQGSVKSPCRRVRRGRFYRQKSRRKRLWPDLLLFERLGEGGGDRRRWKKAEGVDRGQIIKCLIKQSQSLEWVLMAVGKMECEGKLAK